MSPRGVSSGCGKFLSTPSARRATLVGARLKFLRDNFYPRPPRGGRRCYVVAAGASLVFLSTPSARRATLASRSFCTSALNFYPRPPRGGRHGRTMGVSRWIRFLSTPSARRATDDVKVLHDKEMNFYPRPPRGGRPHDGSRVELDRKFLSTPSARRATAAGETYEDFVEFLSTPSARRATTSPSPASLQICYFYPRPPRGGRPARIPFMVSMAEISIHALREEGDMAWLTQRSTGPYFYPRPPRGGRPSKASPSITKMSHFYPRPPRGGRLLKVASYFGIPKISIHALREEGDCISYGC